MGNPLAGIDSDVWVSSNLSVSATNETCTDSGDHTLYTASIHTAWDKNQPFTVQCSPNGSSGWVTVTDYTVRWAVGQIVFTTARVVATNDHVRISTGSYFTLTQLDYAYTWSLSLVGNNVKTTPFQATGGWEQNTPTTRGGTGKIDRWGTDDLIFKQMGNLLVMQLFVDKSANVRWQFYAHMTGVDTNSDVSDAVKQPLTFTADNDIILLTP